MNTAAAPPFRLHSRKYYALQLASQTCSHHNFSIQIYEKGTKYKCSENIFSPAKI
jgi:hypothetical protein